MHTQRYAEAGVDVRRGGYKAVELMKKHVASTMINGGVRSDLGGGSLVFLSWILRILPPILFWCVEPTGGWVQSSR